MDNYYLYVSMRTDNHDGNTAALPFSSIPC